MRPVEVVDLVAGADAGHFNLVPIDVARPQLSQADVGVGRSFIDVAPRAGLAILGASGGPQAYDFTESQRVGGIAAVPAPK